MDLARLPPSLRTAVERYKESAANAREKARELGKVALAAGEAGATAGLIGYLEGKRTAEGKPPHTIMGAPLENAVAIAAYGAAVTGLAKGLEHHVQAAGSGALSVMAFKKGLQLGGRSGPGSPNLPPG